MIDVGVPVDSEDRFGWAALQRAAEKNRTDVTESLLSRGADVNKRSGDIHSTALHVAARFNSTDAIEVLLMHGASTNIKDRKGKRPIDDAHCKQQFVCWNGNKSKCLAKVQSLIIYQLETCSCVKLHSPG